MTTETVLRTFGVDARAGEVGIEIEVEGSRLPIEVPNWVATRDGSLRGNAMEYVLRRPYARDEVTRVLTSLNEAMDKEGTELIYSGRAGVHVHVNVQELTMTQVFNFICLYLIFEHSLIEYCGENRAGNLFCLRGVDADWMVTRLRSIVRRQKWGDVRTNNFRYASMNVRALSAYGSLEFRAMRSTVDRAVLEPWVKMLLALKDMAVKLETPVNCVEMISTEGPDTMFYRIFGDDTPLRFDFAQVMEGVRLAQHIAYATDQWNVHPMQLLAEEHLPINEEYEHHRKLTRMLTSTEYFEECGKRTVNKYLNHYGDWKHRRVRAQRRRAPATGRPRPIATFTTGAYAEQVRRHEDRVRVDEFLAQTAPVVEAEQIMGDEPEWDEE